MTQQDLFGEVPQKFTRSGSSIVPPTREEQARQARDDGIARAVNHANNVLPSWGERAYIHFCEYARFHAVEFITEDVREYAYRQGFVRPPDERAWGAISTRATRAGIVYKVDDSGRAKNPRGHMHPCSLWHSNINGRPA